MHQASKLLSILSLSLCVLLLSFALSFAQEDGSAPAPTGPDTPVQVGTLPPRPDTPSSDSKVKPPKPGYDVKTLKNGRTMEQGRAQIQNIRTEAQETRQEFRTEAQDKREDFRQGLKADMQNAATGTRRDIMKGAIEDRKELQKEIQGDRTQMREELKTKREEVRGEIKERKAALKDRIKDALKERLGTAIGRLNKATKQFDGLTTRIQTRIDKLKGAGVDTSTAETALASATALITTAKADITALESLVNTASSNADDTATESIKAQIKTALEKATASIKAAHEGLKVTTQELAKLKMPRTATTTNSN